MNNTTNETNAEQGQQGAAMQKPALNDTEIELMLAMRRNQDLIVQYRGQQPADRLLNENRPPC